MKVIKMQCPSCHANLEIQDSMMFCSYCGMKLMIKEDETSINIQYTTRDEAKIRESERKENETRMKLEHEARDQKRTMIFLACWFGGLFLVCMLMAFLLPLLD